MRICAYAVAVTAIPAGYAVIFLLGAYHDTRLHVYCVRVTIRACTFIVRVSRFCVWLRIMTRACAVILDYSNNTKKRPRIAMR